MTSDNNAFPHYLASVDRIKVHRKHFYFYVLVFMINASFKTRWHLKTAVKWFQCSFSLVMNRDKYVPVSTQSQYP